MKNSLLLIVLLAVATLSATYDYYPMTTLAEAGVIWGNTTCEFAYIGLNAVLGETTRSEFISTRLYHASNDLSSVTGEQRFADYGIMNVPTVIFNGSIYLIGAIPTGAFRDLVNSYRFSASPLKIELTSFDAVGGLLAGTVTMLDSTLVLADQDLVCMLVEDDIGLSTNVVREVLIENISLSGAGNQVSFDVGFTIDANWNPNNFWAVASVQLENRMILQSASTLPLPTHNIRAAYDFDGQNLVADTLTSFLAEPFWIFNTGASDNMEIRIIVDSGPADWYFNYCDEEGNCYPGDTPLPLNMNAGEARAFHLNVWLGSSGIANIHFQITSPGLGTFTVPFTLRSSDYVSNDDQLLPPAVVLGANYPNPFRANTNFTVTADKAVSQACIQIFNIKGQKIAETPLQSLHQGQNTISWQTPENLPAGVYFYRVKDEPSTLRRMLLLK